MCAPFLIGAFSEEHQQRLMMIEIKRHPQYEMATSRFRSNSSLFVWIRAQTHLSSWGKHTVLPLACDFHAILNRCAHHGECCFKTTNLGRNMGSLEVAEWTHSSPGGNVSIYLCTGKRVQLRCSPREPIRGLEPMLQSKVQFSTCAVVLHQDGRKILQKKTPQVGFESQPSLSLSMTVSSLRP